MIVNIFHYVLGMLIPFAAEQYAYSRLVPGKNKQKPEIVETISQGYGWRIIWDAAYLLLFIAAGYRIIILIAPLSTWEWLGYFCFLFGVILRIGSLKELGQFYNSGIVIKADHQIVQTGPYRALRHPLHLGTLLEITGLAFFSPLWLGLPTMLASFLLDLYLNRLEDLAHARRFGASFRSYYLKTWDVIDLIFWKNRSE